MAEGLRALVTLTHIASLKLALRTRLSSLRSAHADEVIAAGLGYRTYAALLAAFKNQAALVVVFDLDRAKARLRELCSNVDLEAVGPAVDEFIHGNLRAVLEAQQMRMSAAIANDN